MARGFRRERLEREIFRQVTLVMRLELKDPRLAHVTLTRVELSKDMSFAKLLVSDVAEGDEAARQLSILNRTRHILRKRLATELGIRRIPELRFDRDKGAQNVFAVEKTLRALAPDREEARELPGSEEDGT